MSDDITPSQEQALLRLLSKVMEVLRDNSPLSANDFAYGTLASTIVFKPGEAGKTYSFRNSAFPGAKVDFVDMDRPARLRRRQNARASGARLV